MRPESATDLLGIIRTVEAASGLRFLIWPLAEPSRTAFHNALPGELFSHQHAFCTHVKETAGHQPCIRCDREEMFAICRTRREILVRPCHAGAEEAILPIHGREQLLAIAYLGIFRRAGQSPPPGAFADELPELDQEGRIQLRRLCLLLQAYLERHATACMRERNPDRDHRVERIEAFLDRELASNPDLGRLGEELGVSASRAGHIVKAWTGRSFRAWKEEKRLARAQDYLSGASIKIERIAHECGFPDPCYFYRYFRKKTGMTPAAYRERYGIAPDA